MFTSVNALEFRCCREIPLVNQKLTLTKESAVSGRGYRRDRLSGRTDRKINEFIVMWFKLISTYDFKGENVFSLSAALPHDPFR